MTRPDEWRRLGAGTEPVDDPAPLYDRTPPDTPSGAGIIVAALAAVAQQRAKRKRSGRR